MKTQTSILLQTGLYTGGFINAGQVCISVQRVLVHRPVYDRTLEKILSSVKALKVGDPREPSTDIGPMIDKEKAEEAYRKVQEAVKQGARILDRGRHLKEHCLRQR